MPAECASASGGELAKKPDFVTIDEAGFPVRIVDARGRPGEAECVAESAGRALRIVGAYIFVWALMRAVERSGTTAETLELKKASGNWRLQETMRVCEARIVRRFQ